MSEGAPPAEPPTKQMAEVRLDADGKPLSKNALKKLLKAEKAAKAKAEKEAKRVRCVVHLVVLCVFLGANPWQAPTLVMAKEVCRRVKVLYLLILLLTYPVSLSTPHITCR